MCVRMQGATAVGDGSPRVAFDAVADISVWAGAFGAVGDRNPVPGRVGCPRRGGVHPVAWNVPGRTVQGWVGWRMRHSWEGCCLSGLVVVGVCVGRRR